MKQRRLFIFLASLVAVFSAGTALALADTSTTPSSILFPIVKTTHVSGIVANLSSGAFNLLSSNGKSYAVAPTGGALILVNSQVASMSMLANGMQAGVYGTWSGGTSTIAATVVSSEDASYYGTVTAVSTGAFTITSGTHSTTVVPSSGAYVLVDRLPSTATNIVPGMTVTAYGLWNDADHKTLNASFISAAHGSVGGKVGQTSGTQFVVVNGNGKQSTVGAGSSAVLKGGAPSSLSDVVTGTPVTAYGLWSDATQSTLSASVVYVNGRGITATPTGWCYSFYKNLRVGSHGPEVLKLQTALNQSGFQVATTGDFDQSTASAVSGFQEKYASEILTPNGLTYGTGYVGNATRIKLNSLYQCANPVNSQGNDWDQDRGDWR